MPRGSPFTALCRQAADLVRPPAADLHTHTTASDGEYTPSQLVAFARKARLAAVAITDHDTVAGVGPAIECVRQLVPAAPEVVPGAELTAEYDGREYHVLGLFLRVDDQRLTASLADVCERRRERFRNYLVTFETRGVRFPDGLAAVTETRAVSLGRRHVATMLVNAGHARSNGDAFRRFLLPAANAVPAIHRSPIRDVIRSIRDSGGVSVLAHPPEDIEDETIAEFARLGLLGLEVTFPAATAGRSHRLRELSRRHGLAASGGSDCHGPAEGVRRVGGRGISRDELHALRRYAVSPG